VGFESAGLKTGKTANVMERKKYLAFSIPNFTGKPVCKVPTQAKSYSLKNTYASGCISDLNETRE
jgi:hypothetical protein